jgi:hypothetical protein
MMVMNDDYYGDNNGGGDDSVQFNSYLFSWKFNSPKASYKVSTRKKKETTANTNKIQNMAVYIVIVMVPTQHPVQWVPGALSPGVKRQGCEADHSPPSSAEAKKGGAIPPLPHMSSWHRPGMANL